MNDADFLRSVAEKDYLTDDMREGMKKLASKKDTCWCKDCEYGYTDGLADITCVNRESDWVTEPRNEFDSCKNCVRRG